MSFNCRIFFYFFFHPLKYSCDFSIYSVNMLMLADAFDIVNKACIAMIVPTCSIFLKKDVKLFHIYIPMLFLFCNILVKLWG